MPVVVASANAPRLGIAFPYAPDVNGVPKPKANGGITLGAPNPFTKIRTKRCDLGDNLTARLRLSNFVFGKGDRDLILCNTFK